MTKRKKNLRVRKNQRKKVKNNILTKRAIQSKRVALFILYNMRKTFGKLNAGDSLYYLNPNNLTIKETQIVSIFEIRKQNSPKTSFLGFKVYKNLLDKAPNITIDRLELIKEDMSNSIYHVLLLKRDETNMIIPYLGVPSVIATSKEEIQEWIKQ